jgi:hypothetical protein
MMSVRRRPLMVLAVALVLVGGASGCAAVPTGVVNVPGSATFGQHIVAFDLSGPAYGLVQGMAVLCVDTQSALKVEISGAMYSVSVSVAGSGGVQVVYAGQPWTTPPVGPGCGTLGVLQLPGHVDPSGLATVTVTISKA